MWGNQGYDQNDHGGGYIGGSQGDNQGGSNQERKKRSASILPCTVAQLLGAEQVDDKFVCGGVDLNQVSLVGIVRSVQKMPTSHVYEIDDMTGPVMDVRTFVDNDEGADETEKTAPEPENTYVYLNGHLRAYNGKKSVTAFKIRRILDMNEITTHMLEVVHSHLQLSRQNQSMPGRAPGLPSNVPQGSFFGDGGLDTTQPHNKVLKLLRSLMQDHREGVTASVIARMGSMSQRDVENAFEFLASEGHIYTTIDDFHFKTTDFP